MHMKLISVLLFFGTAMTALGAPDSRHLWVHDAGYLLDLKNDLHEWIETIDGAIRFTFKEESRDDSAVYLYDSSRNLYVYLTLNELNGGTDRHRPFQTLRRGGWDNRRVLFGNNGGTAVTFGLRPANLWNVSWRQQDGTFYALEFREVRRDIGVVEIRNDQLNRRFLILNDGKVFENNGPGSPTIPITTDGRWSDPYPYH